VVLRRDLIAMLGGAAAAWPAVVCAQQKAMPVIGWLNPNAPGPFTPFVDAFQQGLSETGFVVGQNVAIEFRWAEGHFDQLPALARDLVVGKVDVILAGGPDAAHAAKTATATIPIVFHSGDDPIAAGLVPSLARPGGNLTGVAFMTTELDTKRLQLLAELVPGAKAIGLLMTDAPNNESAYIRGAQQAARATHVEIIFLQASTDSELDGAFAAVAQRQAGGIVVPTTAFLNSHRERVLALAAHHAVPAIYSFCDYVTAGGLMAYGASLAGVYRQDGIYVGKILDGAKPADLPVQQPTKFELVINLKTAKALGLTVPQAILARADEVIE
jgi:putative ABC transport system substrate-binding protein